MPGKGTSLISVSGLAAVLTAVFGSIFTIVRAVTWFRRGEGDLRRRLRVPVLMIAGGAVAAFLLLELALLVDDFSIEYVAEHHSRSTPLIFAVATAWAALEGSIVLWGLVLAGYVFTVHRKLTSSDRLGAAAMVVLGGVSLFFFIVIATIANPFAAVFPIPLDGPGPNTLLQNNILMAVHPPLLYLGYVGFTVPFAFAIGALVLGEQGTVWLKRTHRWSLVAWSFLSAGIVAGAWWSYSVLGWGGYWAWDPVENASFLPWLVGTAFIHSALVQMRRGMLQAWNVILVIATFSLTILGTFLTRSGVVASVHSFTQSSIGPTLLAFLLLVVVGSLTLFATRAHLVAAAPRLDSFVSREGSFLANNLLLTLFAFVVLTGTLFPLVVEAFSGDQVSVGRPFFDRLAIPISFALLLILGVGPVTPWRVADPSILWERIRIPFWSALGAGVIAVGLGQRVPYVVLVLMLAVFIVAVIVRLLLVTANAAAKKSGLGMARSVLRVTTGDPGFWGGQISHIGVAVLALAMAVSANLVVRENLTIPTGESVVFASHDLEYVGPFINEEPNRGVFGAEIVVSRNGRTMAELTPRFHVYPNQVQPVVTPSIWVSPRFDMYLTPLAISSEQVRVTAFYYPAISYLWVGGFLVAFGGVWALFARRGARSTEASGERVGQRV